MSDRVLLDNVERLMKVHGLSADALSKAAKRPDAVRNLRRRVAGDKQGSWTLDTLQDIARALETSPWELLRPPGALPQDDGLREIVRGLVAEEMGAHQAGPHQAGPRQAGPRRRAR